MTDDEKQILKVGAEAAIKPFSSLLERLFGGVVDEVGGAWQDSLKVRRLARRLKLYRRLQSIIADCGLDPEQIPENIWVPALQQASLEDDESLQDRWAALLANASDPDQTVPQSFPAILSQLTPDDAAILDFLFERYAGELQGDTDGTLYLGSYRDIVKMVRTHLARREVGIVLDNLLRLRLILVEAKTVFETPENVMGIALAGSVGIPGYSDKQVTLRNAENLRFTRLGLNFVKACRPPLPVSN